MIRRASGAFPVLLARRVYVPEVLSRKEVFPERGSFYGE
jgi:hypothetical protein